MWTGQNLVHIYLLQHLDTRRSLWYAPKSAYLCRQFEVGKMHTAKYERNPHEALYRVTCTCGWCRVAASLEECEAAFTGHDLWQPVEAWKARLREIGRVK